jgi:HK97 family phage portal protein
MGLVDRIRADSGVRAEHRIIGGVPWRPWDSPYVRFDSGGPVHPSRAFYGVDEALGLPALYSCARLLADSVASLPLKIYTRAAPGAKPVRYDGPSIFDQPSVTGTLYDWLFSAMTSLVLFGNAWGFITGRDGFGFPTGIEWIPAEDVTCADDEQQPWNPMRTRVYVYGRLIDDWRTELFHVKAFSIPGRTEGISPLRAFALTVTSGIEAARYGTDWYRAGGFPPGTFQNNEIEIDADQAAEIRASLTASIRRREPLVYGRDWDYKPVTVPPSEAQFVEAIQMNATQMAAIFGLPPDRVGGRRGDSLTYNCVDAETEILTTRGWLRHDQVTAGDVCLTLSTKSSYAEWQPVTSVHVFDAGPYPVIRLENSSHSSVSTPDHRWPVMLSGRRAGYNGWAWRTTGTLPVDSRVCAALEVDAPETAKWSDAFAELVAWFWTEGWAGKYGSVTLTQSETANPGHVARIRTALTEVFGPAGELQVRSRPSWREDHGERGIVHFRLNAKAGRQLLAVAPGKIVSTQFLAELTRAQLELFISTSVDADGCWRVTADGTAVIAQKDRGRLDAFQVACALAGRSGVIHGPNVAGMWTLCLQNTPWRKPAGHAEYISQETADLVWCVQTPNQSWFARRNGTCYFTGNTVEQSTLQVIEALRPWLVRLESAFFGLLPQRRYTRFNADALLKTDLKTRMDIYQIARNIGLRTTDELREMEDLEPLPGAAGGETIPLEVMVAMSRSIRGIPNSMLPGLTLEMDLAADRLQKLQGAGLAAPGTEPAAMSPEQLLGNILGSQRGAGGDSDLALIAAWLRSQQGIRQRGPAAEPEFVGPWVPDDRELAAACSGNGNGNGGGH